MGWRTPRPFPRRAPYQADGTAAVTANRLLRRYRHRSASLLIVGICMMARGAYLCHLNEHSSILQPPTVSLPKRGRTLVLRRAISFKESVYETLLLRIPLFDFQSCTRLHCLSVTPSNASDKAGIDLYRRRGANAWTRWTTGSRIYLILQMWQHGILHKSKADVQR